MMELVSMMNFLQKKKNLILAITHMTIVQKAIAIKVAVQIQNKMI